jgi:hypothetical protein
VDQELRLFGLDLRGLGKELVYSGGWNGSSVAFSFNPPEVFLKSSHEPPPTATYHPSR